jgi:hypothetical protein
MGRRALSAYCFSKAPQLCHSNEACMALFTKAGKRAAFWQPIFNRAQARLARAPKLCARAFPRFWEAVAHHRALASGAARP